MLLFRGKYFIGLLYLDGNDEWGGMKKLKNQQMRVADWGEERMVYKGIEAMGTTLNNTIVASEDLALAQDWYLHRF